MKRSRGGHPDSDTLRQWHTLQLSKIELDMQQQALAALQQRGQQAQAGQALYQLLFEQSPACSYALDEAGRVACANRAGAALLAHSAAALKGQPFERYLAPGGQPGWRALALALREGASGGGIVSAGMDTQLFDGIPGACAVRLEASLDAATGVCCVVLVPQAVAPGTRDVRTVQIAQAAQAAQAAARAAALERENAQLRRQLAAHADTEQGLRLLAGHEADTLESARLDMARTMHDEVGQNLLALRIEAALLNQRTQARQGPLHRRSCAALDNADAALRSVRAVLNQLRPAVLDLGLQAAIDWQLAEFRKRSGLACTLDAPDEQVFHCLEDSAGLLLFRQLQAALASVQLDAAASAVAVSLQRTGSGVLLQVSDDGAGDSCRAGEPGRRQRQVLAMMAIGERLRAHGGVLRVEYGASQGCRISMRLPAVHG